MTTLPESWGWNVALRATKGSFRRTFTTHQLFSWVSFFALVCSVRGAHTFGSAYGVWVKQNVSGNVKLPSCEKRLFYFARCTACWGMKWILWMGNVPPYQIPSSSFRTDNDTYFVNQPAAYEYCSTTRHDRQWGWGKTGFALPEQMGRKMTSDIIHTLVWCYYVLYHFLVKP